MANDPCVSVIIPTYNCASFIAQAVQSVLDQSFNDKEIIVVDDGSTDETQRVLEPFAGKILSLVTENKGPAHARNVGMKAASGKYIAFLDADDMYLPHKLEMQVAFMENHPDIGMVSTNWSSMVDGKIAEISHLMTYHLLFKESGWTYEDVYPVRDVFHFRGETIPCYSGNVFKPMLHGPILISNTALFPRKILQEVGYQNEAYPNAQDYELMLRICKRFSVAFLDTPAYVYRYHDNQISMARQAKTKRTLHAQIQTETTFVRAVLDWGYADAYFYAENRSWLDRILAKKYLCLGEKWLEYGDSRRARECFSKGRDFDPTLKDIRRYFWFSFLPQSARRGAFWLQRRLA